METKKRDLAIQLFKINAYKFGDFKLKSGSQSPVYFDLRVIVSYPEVMDLLSDILMEFMAEQKIDYDHVCGVPYTALPIATLISVKAKKPMLIRRKETKDYGTRKLIEGKFASGENCLIIEDVVTSGSSVLETVRDLKAEGLNVTDAIIVVDREQGGSAAIENNGVKMQSLFTLSYLLKVLSEAELIEEKMVANVARYISENQVNGLAPPAKILRTKMTFESRAALAKSVVGKNLLNLMALKKTNLCLAADVTKTADVLKIAQLAGPFICVLKLHVDIIEDFTQEFVASLTSIAKMHNFMLMEDRKFADIGNTVSLQYTSGLFKISEWADLVTAHTLPGCSLLKGLKARACAENRGVFLLAELSSAGNLINAQYTSESVKLATEGDDVDFVAGVVCQNGSLLEQHPGVIQLTPGVKLEKGGDDLGQQYDTPHHVMREKGADIAVVGRGIYEAKNVAVVAENYRDALWAEYLERVNL